MDQAYNTKRLLGKTLKEMMAENPVESPMPIRTNVFIITPLPVNTFRAAMCII